MLSSLFPQAHGRYSSLPVLGELWEGFCDWLDQQGYPRDAIRRRVQAGPLVADALRRQRIRSLEELNASDLRGLMPCPSRWTEEIACSLVRSLAEYLEQQGKLLAASLTRTDEMTAAYGRYLENVRGLAPTTVVQHCRWAAQFLQSFDYNARPEQLRKLNVADVDAFIGDAGHRLGRASMQKLTGILRSFLRFLGAEGEVPAGFDACIDSPRCFRGERLPRAVPWETVRSLLRSIDRSTAKGRRDFAMLLLIATYGLRVGEIASLELDDVQWRSRQIRVPRPKIGTALLLPLTDECATALLEYVRSARPPLNHHRHLFLRVRIPLGPIKSTAVSDAFDVWSERAGIQLPRGVGGPHCLRHSLAVHLLRQGVSVKTIGDLLGHRSVESTCVYLRLHVEDLRDVALSLPKPSEVEQ